MALGSAPGKHQRDHGKTARAQSQPTREAMLQMAEAQIATGERNPALVRHNLQTKRSPNRVLKCLLQQQKIRRAKPVVTITAERERAVDVLPSQRLLKIERYGARRRVD